MRSYRHRHDDGKPQRTGRRVGELAAATGLTVRTLHYYEEIGLLVASGRSDAGHRLYADADVERLYRICLLRRLGLPLGEIGRALDDPAWSLRAAMTTQLARSRPPGRGRRAGCAAGSRSSSDRRAHPTDH